MSKSKGDITLTKAEQDKLEFAEEWVERQRASLETCGDAVRKLDAGDELTRKDRLTLVEHLGVSTEELDALHAREPNPQGLKNFFREPVAHFIIARGSTQYAVIVRPDGHTIVPEDSDEYISLLTS